MVAWHRSGKADILLRLLGLSLCAVAYLAFARLVALHIPPGGPSPAVTYALALVGFAFGSSGSALAVLGRHVFDEVEVSARWRTPRPDLVAEDRRRLAADHPRHPVSRGDDAALPRGPAVLPFTMPRGAALRAHG